MPAHYVNGPGWTAIACTPKGSRHRITDADMEALDQGATALRREIRRRKNRLNEDAAAELAGRVLNTLAPTRVVLHCPHCGKQHIDKGKWATFPHPRHLCYSCNRFFETPAGATIGVESP